MCVWWIRSRTDSRKRLSYCRTDSHEWAPRISQDPVEHAYTALGHGRPANITSTSHGNTTAEGPLLMLVVRMCVRNHISISSTTTHPIYLWIHQLTYTKPSWTQIRLFITTHMYIHGLLFRGISKISIHCNGKIKTKYVAEAQPYYLLNTWESVKCFLACLSRRNLIKNI